MTFLTDYKYKYKINLLIFDTVKLNALLNEVLEIQMFICLQIQVYKIKVSKIQIITFG